MMKAIDYDGLDVSSSSRRLCESIKENGGLNEAIKHICPLDYSILFQLLKAYKKTYPTMAIEMCQQTTEYIG